MKKFDLNDYIVTPEEKIAKRVIYDDENTLAFVLNIAPNESLPEHTHFDSTVLVQVIKGEAKVNVNDKNVNLSKHGLIEIDGPETMSIDNIAQDSLVLYVTISPLPPEDKYAKDANI